MGAPSAPSPSSDASYLHRLLEGQPAGLIRVRLDGVLLACNSAALGLFGADLQRALVSRNLVDRIVPAQQTQWQGFMARCWAMGAASLECDLVIRNNEARRVLIQGAALKDYPDGIESLLLHLCDQSQPQPLEQSILSAVINLLHAERQRAGRDQITEASVERLEAGVPVDEDRAERRPLIEALEPPSADRHRGEAKFVELEKKLEASQLTSLQKEREYRRDVAMLKAALAAAHAAKAAAVAENQELESLKPRLQTATAEQVRLQALVAEYEIDRTRIVAEHQRALADLRASKDAALADLHSQLARTSGAHGTLAKRVELAEHELELLRAEHQRRLADLQTATGVVAGLRHQLLQASAEQDRRAARLEEDEHERLRLVADHHSVLADMEIRSREVAELRAERVRLEALVGEYETERKRTAADHQAVVDRLEQSLAQALAEQSRMASRADEQTREQDLMRAEHERAHERLIAEHHRALANVETGNREALDELRSQQSQVVADQRRLVAQREEHERERDCLIAEHHRALSDMETGKSEALAELRSQLSQAFADQRRLTTRADEQELELDRLRAEHYAALTDVETRNRDVLAELRAELDQTAAEHARMLAQRAEEHERERNRIGGEHSLAIADLQASKEAAAAELRSQLSAAVAEHRRLTALLEDGDRERERIAAEHRRAIADLQASKHETVAECERVLTEVQQALLVRDASRRLEIERRLGDGIDDGPVTKADGERLASLQRGLTLAFSRVHAVLKDGAAPKEAFEAEHDAVERPSIETVDQQTTASAGDQRLEDADLLREPFDDADDAFVHQLLEGSRATPLFESMPEPNTLAPAQAVSATQSPTAGAQPTDDIFDAQDAAFARDLMSTHRAPGESVDEGDAESPREFPQALPAAPED